MNSGAPKHGMRVRLAITEGKAIPRHPPDSSAGAGWRGAPTASTGRLMLSATFYFYFIFCSYNFIKLPGYKCSFNYSLLLINYLKINIMLLFPFLPLFHYLSNLCCSLILGVFPWHPNGSCCPAIIISVQLITSFSICQPHSSVRAAGPQRHCLGSTGAPLCLPLASSSKKLQILNFWPLGTNWVFFLLFPCIVTLHPAAGYRQQGSDQINQLRAWEDMTAWQGWGTSRYLAISSLLVFHFYPLFWVRLG